MEAKEKKFIHSRPVFYCFLALLLGVASARYIFNYNVQYVVLISLVVFFLLVLFIYFKKYLMLLLIFATLLLGFGWYYVGIVTFKEEEFSDTCQISARITDDITYYKTYAVCELDDVVVNGKNIGKVQMTIFDNLDFAMGDVISFEATLQNSKLFELDNFNLSYYRDSIKYTCSVSGNNIVIEDNYLKFDEQFRKTVKDALYSTMGQDNGATAYAVLFGDKSDMTSDVKSVFRSAGIIHLLTVSGLHIGFLIVLLGFLMKICHVNRYANFIICATILGLYAYLCGFAPSIVRAGIMGLLLLIAKLSGKCYDNLNTLGLAGLTILLYSPLSALDVGYLMSFFCVMGIFVIYSRLSAILRKIFPKFVADSFAISISAQVCIIPFMAIFYSTFNFLSFFINLIVIPIFSILFPVLFISTLLCILAPFLGFLLQASGLAFSLIYKIAEFFSSTNLIVSLKPMNVLLVGLTFVLIFVLSRFFMAKWQKRSAISLILIVFIAISSLVFEYVPMAEASILYGYKYGNNSIILTNSSHESMLIDTTSYYSFENNMLASCSAKEVLLSVQLNSTLDIDITEKFNSLYNVRYVDSSFNKLCNNEIVLQSNQEQKFGDFYVTYLSYNNLLLGLLVEFDGIQVFILNEAITLKEEYIKDFDFDFVMLGKKSSSAKYFSKHTNVLTYYHSSYSDYSYIKNGNIKFVKNSYGFVYRREN